MKITQKDQIREKQRHSGFTLAELLIVVAIIAVLVAVSVPIFISRMDHTKKTVCDYNRKVLVRQISLELMDHEDMTLDEAKKIRDNSDAHCPTGETYTITLNDMFVKVECKIHGSSSGAASGQDQNISSGFIVDYKKFTSQYLKDNPTKSNDDARREFYKECGNQWPTLTVDGTAYSIQPFYQGNDRDKPIDDCVWLFARKTDGSNSGWNASYVYNVVEGKWYGATQWNGKPGGTANITFDDIYSLDNAIKNDTHASGNNKWVVIDDYKESQ